MFTFSGLAHPPARGSGESCCWQTFRLGLASDRVSKRKRKSVGAVWARHLPGFHVFFRLELDLAVHSGNCFRRNQFGVKLIVLRNVAALFEPIAHEFPHFRTLVKASWIVRLFTEP